MTTAHRPTFDHLKGRLDHNKTSIQHKRFAPLHRQLKYRHVSIVSNDDYETSKIDLNKLNKSVQQMRLELIGKEQEHFVDQGIEYRDRYLNRKDMKMIEGPSSEEGESFEARRLRIYQETKDIDLDSESGSEEESESESESEDESELLMKELNKLKERKEEEEKMIRLESLVESKVVKKSWRNETTFHSRRSGKQKAEYVNDMLRNEFHRKFMDRYVK